MKVEVARSEKSDPEAEWYQDKETLKTMYWEGFMSTNAIADHFDVAVSTIRYWMDKHEIPRRSRQQAYEVNSLSFDPESGESQETPQEGEEGSAEVIRRTSQEVDSSAQESRESEVSDDGPPRYEHLDRKSFRALFYSGGLSPREVMDVLDLDPGHVGTLIRIHGVGGFGHTEVPENRIESLREELSGEEWEAVER